MAITQVNIGGYLKMAKALQTVEQRPCWMMFDAEADVLYIMTKPFTSFVRPILTSSLSVLPRES